MNDKFPKPSYLKFSDIKVGFQIYFKHSFSGKDILNFAKLTGDFNPLHLDPEHNIKIFNKNIVHGMLASSLFSALVGMHCPGKNCLYLAQEIEFIKPIYPDEEILVKGTVVKKIESLKILNIVTEILIGKKVAIKGLAKVKVLE